jgi:hypothetical protein
MLDLSGLVLDQVFFEVSNPSNMSITNLLSAQISSGGNVGSILVRPSKTWKWGNRYT